MNCKPGDLAYVTVGVNVGHVVTVRELAARGWVPDGPFRMPPTDEPRWHVEGNGLYIASLGGRIFGGLKTRVILDKYLRPISGVPINDEVTEDVKELA